jgi:hypothetical protein
MIITNVFPSIHQRWQPAKTGPAFTQQESTGESSEKINCNIDGIKVLMEKPKDFFFYSCLKKSTKTHKAVCHLS